MSLVLNNPYVINSIGLALDMFGAWFVAWEVVGQYRGVKFKKVGATVCGGKAEDPQTSEYKKYEKNKSTFMWLGICLLTIGFSLQMYSNYIQNNESFTLISPPEAATPQIISAIRMPQPSILPKPMIEINATIIKANKSTE
jgi:hypothetical protein